MITIFINPIGKHITLDVFDTTKRTVIESQIIEKTGNDFEIIPDVFVNYVKKYNPNELWCIAGPGSFTLMRIITLILNSIAYNSSDIRLKSCHYFDLMKGLESTAILEANRHEYLIRENSGTDILITKSELPHGSYRGYIDGIGVPGYTPFEPTHELVISYFLEKANESRLSPLYIKPPNITIGSKKTLPLS